MNSTCYIKNIVNCVIKQSGKQSPTKCCKAHLNISTQKMRYTNALPLPLPLWAKTLGVGSTNVDTFCCEGHGGRVTRVVSQFKNKSTIVQNQRKSCTKKPNGADQNCFNFLYQYLVRYEISTSLIKPKEIDLKLS